MRGGGGGGGGGASEGRARGALRGAAEGRSAERADGGVYEEGPRGGVRRRPPRLKPRKSYIGMARAMRPGRLQQDSVMRRAHVRRIEEEKGLQGAKAGRAHAQERPA